MHTMLWSMCLVIAGFAFFTLCSNFLYWYETLNAEDSLIPTKHPGVITCLLQYIRGFFGYIICIALIPFGYFLSKQPAAPAAGEDPALPPVILVHGLNNNAAVWWYIGRELRKKGFSVSTYSYCSLFVPLERIVRGLDRHVRELEALRPACRPVFICHSLGGILVRTWLLEVANQKRTAAVFTLGTPHGGSKLAVMAPGALAKHIVPKAPLIVRLREAPPMQGVHCVSFVSPADEAVLPASGLEPPKKPGEQWKCIITHRVGHFSMLFSRRIRNQLLQELQERN